MTTHVIGVRHHSPACAHRVRRVIEAVEPRWILIEGPADMNGRLAEIVLDHRLPIAAFTYYFSGDRRYAAYYPFCEHSPEWIALKLGLERGAEVRFIDLPGFAIDEEELVENRYADRAGTEDYTDRLGAALSERGYDAVWDACFELADEADVDARLDAFFGGLRDVEPTRASDTQREAFMGDYVGWAAHQGGDVVVICGGFHAPVLEQAALRSVATEPTPPAPDPDSRAATWLVPFSEHRLDSFSGYASGLPSPAWYRWAWTDPDPARRALEATARRLRERGVPVSAAETIAAFTQAEMLARVRGHPSIARVDLLDAVASTWVKDALHAPLPWTSRQALAPGTHPVVVELIAAMSGQARGRLASGTPLPPLVAHVEALLDAHDLRPEGRTPRVVELYPGEPETDGRRVVLERLLVLSIAGIDRRSAPEASPQRYTIAEDDDFPATLAEAASYGPTLEAAAISAIEARAADLSDLAGLTELLGAALRAKLPSLSRRALSRLTALVEAEKHFEALGDALRRLLSLLRHAAVSPSDQAALRALVSSATDRALWLVEGIRGAGQLSLGRVDSVVALRDAVVQEEDAIDVPRARVEGVWRRIAQSTEVPPDLRGAALGACVSHGFFSVSDAGEIAGGAFESCGPAELGDYLTGLLSLARELIAADEGVVTGLDDALTRLGPTEFQIALPSLRLAFRRLPSRERAAFAQRIADLHGGSATSMLARHAVPAADVARAQVIEADVTKMMAEVGLDE